jgi:hypothetical protein
MIQIYSDLTHTVYSSISEEFSDYRNTIEPNHEQWQQDVNPNTRSDFFLLERVGIKRVKASYRTNNGVVEPLRYYVKHCFVEFKRRKDVLLDLGH